MPADGMAEFNVCLTPKFVSKVDRSAGWLTVTTRAVVMSCAEKYVEALSKNPDAVSALS